MLLDSKKPFYAISGILILGLLGIVFYFQYQKTIDKNSITVITGDKPIKIQVEFVKTSEELTRGLMNRVSLDENSGMFFVFPDEATRSFWMKNTLIPLDIIFISSNGHINEITTMNPCQENNICQPYESKLPAQFVLEINADQAEKRNISPGDIIQLPQK